MSELVEACQEICIDLQRHLKLIPLASAAAEEGYEPATDAQFDEAVILLEIYEDRVSSMLERLQSDLSKLEQLVVASKTKAP